MPDNIKKTGVQAFWDNKAFTPGQKEYVKGQEDANRATALFAQGVGALGLSGGQVLGLGAAFGAMSAVATRALDAVLGAIQRVLSGLYEFGRSALETGSRVQQLNYIAQILGQKAGYSGEQINALVASLNAQGVSLETANNLIANFLRYNIDLADATRLATAAQDLATLANKGSSEALEGLLHGIVTAQTEVLRMNGAQVNLNQAYKEYAAQIGSTVDALTEQEKVQARVNAVIESGEAVAGAYQVSMQSAGKQIGTLTSRLLPDLMARLGAPFQKAFFNVVTAVNNMVIGFTNLISEGGALYPILIQIGGALAAITEPFTNLSKYLRENGSRLFEEIVNPIREAASSAFDWGWNLIRQYALGIINATSTLITQALQYLGDILRNWFAPGSPPMIAPNIDKWGTETLNEWLKGMTEADFDILEAIQGPLRSALQAMAGAGLIDKDEVGAIFEEISQEMIEALASGDTLGDAFFENLAEAAGDFGPAISELARRQYELAQSEERVRQAEQALADARKRASQAGAAVNQMTAEYNQLLRDGADPQTLEAQRQRINMAREEQKTAEDQAKSAEERVKAEEDLQKTLKDQLDLQRRLVDQLIKLAETQAEGAEDGGGGGGLPLPAPGEDGGGFDPGDIVDPIADAVEQAKIAIQQKLSELWEWIKALWASGIQSLRNIWNRLVGWAAGIWAQIAKYFGFPNWEQIQTSWNTATQWIAQQVQWLIDTLRTWWAEHGQSIQTIIQVAWNRISQIFTTIVGQIVEGIRLSLEFIRGFWERHGADITAIATTTWNAIKRAVELVLEIIGNGFDMWAAIFSGDWSTFWEEIKTNAGLVQELIKSNFNATIENLKSVLNIFINEAKNTWSTGWAAIQSKAAEIWGAIQAKATEIFTVIQSFFALKLAEALDVTGLWGFDMLRRWGNIHEGLRNIATEVWERIRSWIEEKAIAIQSNLTFIFEELKRWWGELWGNIQEAIATIWATIFGDTQTAAQNTADAVEGAISGLWETLDGYIDRAYQWGVDLIGGMVNGVLDSIGDLIEAVTSAIEAAILAAQQALLSESPSKVFRAIGRTMPQGAALGVEDEADQPAAAVSRAMSRAAMAGVPPIVAGATTRNITLNMPTTINGPIDLAAQRAFIIRTVKEAAIL